MSFKIIKIRKRGIVYKFKKYIHNKFHHNQTKKRICIVIASLFILVFSGQAVYNSGVQDLFLKQLSSKLPTDSNGYKNILLVGMGGSGHDGTNLTDTIILAGINKKKSNAYMLSLPRDLYINQEGIIPQRINSIFANHELKIGQQKAMQLLSSTVQNISNVDIHYYMGVNFEAITDVIDALGGLHIYNEKMIYDPFYPGPNYTFETFTLPAGPTKLNGETALKFIRSRKTTSDFDRSRRQQQVISAIKDKAQSREVLTSPSKLKSLYKAIMQNTVTNMQIEDMLFLASTVKNFDTSKLSNLVIHDDNRNKGGFLFVPPKSEYAQAFVLLPIDPAYSYIQKFIDLHHKFPETMLYSGSIVIKNGTDIPGFARKVSAHLSRLGFNVTQITNAESSNIELSEIKHYNLTNQKVLKAISQASFINKHSDIVVSDPDVPIYSEIIIGNDLKEYYDYFTPIEKLTELILQGQKEWYQSPNKPMENDETITTSPNSTTSSPLESEETKAEANSSENESKNASPTVAETQAEAENTELSPTETETKTLTPKTKSLKVQPFINTSSSA